MKCKDCKGTGLYIGLGFTPAETCQRCGGTGEEPVDHTSGLKKISDDVRRIAARLGIAPRDVLSYSEDLTINGIPADEWDSMRRKPSEPSFTVTPQTAGGCPNALAMWAKRMMRETGVHFEIAPEGLIFRSHDHWDSWHTTTAFHTIMQSMNDKVPPAGYVVILSAGDREQRWQT